MRRFQHWCLQQFVRQFTLQDHPQWHEQGVTLVELLAATIITGLVTSVIGFGVITASQANKKLNLLLPGAMT